MRLKSKLALNKDVIAKVVAIDNEMKLLSPVEEKPDQFSIHLNEYTIEEILQSGEFATNYTLLRRHSLETSGPQKIGLKKFGPSQIALFTIEKQVYELLKGIQSPSFLHYYGGHEEVDINGDIHHHLLSLEFVPLGTLDSFLKSQTISWTNLTRMLVNISQGLALLHTERICHRNLSSSKIMVRNNMQCCIADFSQSKLFGRVYQDFSLEGIRDVRYLSPEGFQRDCKDESALKQMDIYALGLVFWELSRRCHDLYQGVVVPPFEVAFQQEIGFDPTFEQMKVLLGKNVRPLFPQIWKDSNPAIQLLKETITDSWDDDGEARLNIETIVQRMMELDTLWMKYRLTTETSGCNPHHLNNTIFVSNLESSLLPSQQLERNPLGLKNDNVVSGQQPSVRIQPYQGLNPCMERNIQHAVINGDFVTGSVKDKRLVKPQEVRPQPSLQSQSQSHRRVNPPPPIQYVYNDIGTNSPRKNTNANCKAYQP